MAKKKKTGKKILIGSVIGAAALALIVWGVIARPARSNYSKVTAETGDITTYYTFSGTISAKNSRVVYADGAAQIKEIDVSEGQSVKKDDVLMKTASGEKITAPIDGTVTEIDADADSLQMQGAKLCKIVDYSNLELDVQVDEYDLPAITVNKDATVTVNALDKDVTGMVTDVSREGVNQNGVTYFDAKVSLPDMSDLRVGMTAQARVLNQSVHSVVKLPMSAIQFSSDNTPYVYMSDGKNRVKKVELTLGVNDGTNVEVKSGLKSGDTVLVPPAGTASTGGFGMGLRSGQSTSRSSSGGTTVSGTGTSGGGSGE